MNDGHAFPQTVRGWNDHLSGFEQRGMSLLDYFAAKAMAALIAKVPLHDREGTLGKSAPTVAEIHGVRRQISRSAYDYAHAMLEARLAATPEPKEEEGRS